jgi:DNA replication protein DnaD
MVEKDKGPTTSKLEELIVDVRKKNRETQASLILASQKLAALAEKESDPFKKEIAEIINGLTSTTNRIVGDIDNLYISALGTSEKLNLLSTIVCTLPEVIQNEELVNGILKKLNNFDDRITKLRESAG